MLNAALTMIKILKSDVTVAKNYLGEKDIRRLERTITGYFDYVEDLIEDEYINLSSVIEEEC